MEKLTLEEFNEICKGIEEISVQFYDLEKLQSLPEEELEKISDAYEKLLQKLSESDLSDIPFEAWSAYIDLSGRLDLEGTGANIDLSLIQTPFIEMSGPIELKLAGCNIRGFVADKSRYSFTDLSFDEEFAKKQIEEHPEMFLVAGIDDPEVIERIHTRSIRISDLKKYPELVKKVEERDLDSSTAQIVKKMGMDEALKLDDEITDTPEVFSSFANEVRIYGTTDLERLKPHIAENLRGFIYGTNVFMNYPERHESLSKNAFAREILPGIIWDFPEGKEELKEKYLSKKLTIKDVLENMDLFEGKEFLSMLEYDQNKNFMGGIGRNVTEEKILTFFKNVPNIDAVLQNYSLGSISGMIAQLDFSKEPKDMQKDISDALYQRMIERVGKGGASIDSYRELFPIRDLVKLVSERAYNNYYIDGMFDEQNLEAIIRNHNVPIDLFSNTGFINFLHTFGPNTVFEFDEENNHFFSKNNFENAKNVDSYFLHYDGNNWDGRTKICVKGYDLETFEYVGFDGRLEYTKDEMYEAVRRMILHRPSDYKLTQNNLNHADMGDEFKSRYPELFLSDNVPAYIRGHYYNAHVTFGDLKKLKETNPEALEEIYSKPESIAFRKTFAQYNRREIDVDIFFRLAEIYGNYINDLDIDTNGRSFEELCTSVEEEIEQNILSGKTKYGPDAPDFIKQKYPEMFIDEESPELLKLLYYPGYIIEDVEGLKEKYADQPELVENILSLSQLREEKKRGAPTLTISVLKDYPEFIDYLEGKNLEFGASFRLKHVVSVFSKEEFFEIAKTDIEALDMISNGGTEKIDRFAKLLKEMPRQYAIRDLKSKHGYTDEEIKLILSDEEVTDEKIIEARNNFVHDTADYRERIMTTPGYVIHCPDDRIDSFDFDEFEKLEDMSNFDVSEHYRRDIAEQVIVTMYSFLGYENAQRVMELPNVGAEELEEAIRRTGIAVSEIYSKNFNIKDNLKVLKTLFDKLTPSLPGGKKNFELFSAVNASLEEGFEGSIEELLEQSFRRAKVEYNPDRLTQILRNTKNVNTLNKLETISPAIENYINANMVATPDNKRILAEILTNAMRRSFREAEKIDIGTIEEFIDKEFSKTKQNGSPYYSPHITSKKGELLEIVQYLNSHPEYSQIANKTTVDILQEEKDKIGKGWIRKLLGIETQKITEEELMSLKKKLYGDRDIEIPVEKHFELKDQSAKGVEEAYILLKEMELPGVFTIEKGEIMFAGLTQPYSDGFRKMFMENFEEIMKLPEYFTAFQLMHRRFDAIVQDPDVVNRYAAGKFTLKDLLDAAKNVTFDNVVEGEYELAYRAKKSNLSQEEYNAAKEVYAQMLEREKQSVPPVEHNGKRYRGRILRSDDALHLTIGNITTCCQRFGTGQPGETSMIHSATEENGSVFVVEEIDEYGNVINTLAQSWTWRNNDRVCFDNVEIPNQLESELVQKNAHHEIFEIYRQVAQKMIEVDKAALQKLVTSGKITQEQYEALVIKQVTMGTGCDNLVGHLSSEDRSKMKRAKTIRPKEYNKRYSGVNKNAGLYVDSTEQFVIAENEEMVGIKTKSSLELEDIGFGYTKIRGITRRDNAEGIHKDLISRIKRMNQRAGEEVASESLIASSMSYSIQGILNEDYTMTDAKPYLSFSEDDDWYIFYTEKNNQIVIQDSLLLPQEDASEQDIRMSKLEYIREILLIAKKAKTMQKTFKLSANREGKFIDLAKFAQEDIIEVDANGVVTIKDDARCDAMINSLDNSLSQEKTDRILNTIKPSDPETPSTPTEENDLEER